jgi:hypothetical protein
MGHGITPAASPAMNHRDWIPAASINSPMSGVPTTTTTNRGHCRYMAAAARVVRLTAFSCCHALSPFLSTPKGVDCTQLDENWISFTAMSTNTSSPLGRTTHCISSTAHPPVNRSPLGPGFFYEPALTVTDHLWIASHPAVFHSPPGISHPSYFGCGCHRLGPLVLS